MRGILIGLALALSASLAQGAGYLCQHLTAGERPPVSARRLRRTLGSMLASGWWKVGLLLGALGFLLHLSALALAPISLVQTFVAGGLALTVPLAARVFHHRLSTTERRAVPLMAISLAALSLGLSGGDNPGFDGGALTLYLGALIAAAIVLATAVDGPLRHPALGLAAGLFYGALDTATKALTDLARTGGLGSALTSPLLAVAVIAGLAAFFCFQRALQTNRPLTAIAVMEAGATGGGVIAGFVAFGEALGATPALGLLHLAAFAGVGVAAWSLAPAQARLAESAGSPDADAGWAQPVAGVTERDGHLGAPESPVVFAGRLGGPDADSESA